MMNPFMAKEIQTSKEVKETINRMKAFEVPEKRNLSVDGMKDWLGRDHIDQAVLNNKGALNDIRRMMNGEVNGNKALGLNDIQKWKINNNYQNQNIRQHAGFAAEIISTVKENLQSKFDKTGITTCRADDLPTEYGYRKNDQYVDKVRLDGKGNVIEKIQMKFVGNNAEENLKKLQSKKYDKYFEDGKVDKIEIPRDFFDDVKKLIPQEKSKLQKQLDRVKADGKTDAAAGLQNRIERLDKIDKMLEKSTVGSDEARYATLHPRRYASGLLVKDIVKAGNETGKEFGKQGAMITAAISTVNNFSDVMKGECTAKEAVKNIAKDTTKSGAIGYGTGFLSGGITRAMSQSSHELIRSASKANIPGVVISFVVDSYDSIVDYAKGEMHGGELAKDMGRSAAGIAGSIGASAAAGAALGSVFPGAGNAVGAVVGIVSSMAGYALAATSYNSALEFGNKEAPKLLKKCSDVYQNTMDRVKEECPHRINEIKETFEKFNKENKIPIPVI